MNSSDYFLYDAYSNHITASESFSITNGYVRNSQHLQNSLVCWFRALELKWQKCLGATRALITLTEIPLPKLFWRCAYTTLYHNLVICEETASECFPYASTLPNRFMHSWFPKTGFWNLLVWKCWFSNVFFWHWITT
jgi:hypothetical protein